MKDLLHNEAVKQNENCSYIYRGGIIQIQRRKSKSDRDGEKVIKRAHCFQSARTSLSFRPCWIPAIQMTGVRRKGLQRISPSPSQQLPFMRLHWLWGHLHHNSCHFAPPPHPSSAHSLSETNTYTGTHIQWQTYTHTKLLQLNAKGENQKGIRDGCCLRTPPMCGFLWMGPKGGEVSDSTGCTLLGPLGCVTMVGGVERVTNPRFSTRMTAWHSTRACYTTVTWVGQVTFDPMELSHMCPLCHGFCINFTHLHSMDLTRFQYKA